MDVNNALLSTGGAYLVQAPIVLVWLVGIGLAVAHWQRHPRVSLLVVSAIVLSLLTVLIGTPLNLWLPLATRNFGWSTGQLGVVLLLTNVVRSLIAAVAWGLMIAAVFAWRGERQGR